jgi:hypothetical protein
MGAPSLHSGMSDPRTVVAAFVASLEGETRQVAEREWGITVQAAGWPLHVGVALRDGLLRAQAAVVGPGELHEHDLLRWNRTLPLIRFAHTRAGEVWVQGDLPLAAVSPGELDRFLGLLVLSATQARQHAAGPGRDSAGSPTAPA